MVGACSNAPTTLKRPHQMMEYKLMSEVPKKDIYNTTTAEDTTNTTNKPSRNGASEKSLVNTNQDNAIANKRKHQAQSHECMRQ